MESKSEYYNFERATRSVFLKKIGKNYRMSDLNKMSISDYEMVLIEGVKIRVTERDDQMVLLDLSSKKKKSLDKLHNEPLFRFDINTLPDIAIQILNAQPMLGSATCMGWDDFDDKSKDPNWYSGSYYLPDGNVYTIIKSRSWVQIFPCEGDHCLSYGKKLPLFQFEIDPIAWSRKVYEKSEEKLEIIK